MPRGNCLPVSRVEETLRAAKLPISLETPVGEDGETSVGDLVPDMEATDLQAAAERSDLARRLDDVKAGEIDLAI